VLLVALQRVVRWRSGVDKAMKRAGLRPVNEEVARKSWQGESEESTGSDDLLVVEKT
jgi:hypothetical protein